MQPKYALNEWIMRKITEILCSLRVLTVASPVTTIFEIGVYGSYGDLLCREWTAGASSMANIMQAPNPKLISPMSLILSYHFRKYFLYKYSVK